MKGSDIDFVLLKLKELKAPYSAKEISEYLPDMPFLVVDEVYKYLYNNHSKMFNSCSVSNLKGIVIQYGHKTENLLNNGGFTKHFRGNEDLNALKTRIYELELEKLELEKQNREKANKMESVLLGAKVGIPVIKEVMRILRGGV